jgi:hypothetical protein
MGYGNQKKQVMPNPISDNTLEEFLNGKSIHALTLFHHFVDQYKRMGSITVHPAKTMIGIATPRKRIAYITQLGKTFIHVVFPFEKAYPDNLCFQKIALVPMPDGKSNNTKQFNHHFRMTALEDINEEVRSFMKLALKTGS